MSFKLLNKVVSIFTLVAFLATNVAYAAPESKSIFKNKKVNHQKISDKNEGVIQQKKSVLTGEDAKEAESQKKEAQKILSTHLSDISLIHIPQELGKVVEVYQNPDQDNSRLIVHIQDLHTNPEASLNLAGILEILVKDYNLGLVCSEGADGEVDTSSVSSFPDSEVRKKVARLFVDSGELTGEEYLSITKYPDLPIWGIENKDIYFKNIEEFNNIMKFNPDSRVFISQAKKALEELKPKIYSKELLAIDQKEVDYETQKTETADHLKYLSSYIQKLNIPTDNYKNIAILNETIDKESKIDQQKIMQESQNLLLNLQSAIAAKSSRSDMDTLVAKANLFKDQKISPFSFYSYLKDLANKHLKDQASKYPNLMDFVDYLTKVNSLESVKLFVEMEDLSYEIKQKLAKNDEEKTLTQALRNIKFLEGFFNLKISNEELDYYLNNKGSHKVAFFEAFLKPAVKKYNISGFVDFNPELIDSHLQYIEDFYKTVKARDLAMVTNATSEVEKRNVKVATLITGGFHTQGITRLLKEKGYSYIVISPFSKTEIDEENYHFLLSGKRKPIEDLIKQLDTAPETENKISASKNLRVPMTSVERIKDAIDMIPGKRPETVSAARVRPADIKSETENRLADILQREDIIDDNKIAAKAIVDDLIRRLNFEIRDLSGMSFNLEEGYYRDEEGEAIHNSNRYLRYLGVITSQGQKIGYYITTAEKGRDSEFEIARSVSLKKAGPQFIYAEEGKPDGRRNFMIVAGLENAENLTKEEEFLVGRSLAEKMYALLDVSKGSAVMHKLNNLRAHLFVIRGEDGVDARFIDWGGTKAVTNDNRRDLAEKSIYTIFESYIYFSGLTGYFKNPEVALAAFLSRLKEVALQSSREEFDFYNDVLDKVYARAVTKPEFGLNNSAKYKALYAKANPLMEEINARLGSFSPSGLTARKVGQAMKGAKGWLERGWTLANHILVSFHAAFILSVLVLPAVMRGEVLTFMFFSPETLVSIGFLWASYHTGVAVHEMGHYVTSVKVGALNDQLLPEAEKMLQKGFFKKLAWYAKMFVLIPYGKFTGVIKTGLSYHPDAEYNLAQTAAGPRWSRNLAFVALPIAAVLAGIGLFGGNVLATYAGRFVFGMGIVGFLDYKMADPGEYKKFQERERLAALRAEEATKKAEKAGRWIDRVARVKKHMIESRPQIVRTKEGLLVWAPWQFRNCGMGGRHTEKQYPNSNISMQETMFNPLSPKNYEDAQEMTMKLQTRLQEIIEAAEGCRVMGIGLEGGLAPYITKEAGDIVPEQRLWRMAKQAILDCGYVPGVDVAIALDPACSELENAYREENNDPKAIGMYLFWRDKEKVVMTRDELYDFFRKTIEDDDIPIVSIEDGFAEDDDAGWKLINEKLGDKLFIIGDDSVTTRDSSIEHAADNNLNNTFLCKANQIGTLSETLLAILVALGKNLDIVVSHRSKSPNDDMEAQIALASFAAGLKTGGGANTERLMKYGSVMRVMAEAVRDAQVATAEMTPEARAEMLESEQIAGNLIDRLVITEIIGWEEATNAGIPTVKVRISFGVEGSKKFNKLFVYEGSTPLGTSAGTGEAIHLVDSVIYESQIPDEKYKNLFSLKSDGSYRFNKGVTRDQIEAIGDAGLTELFRRSQRYEGKGCLNAVDHVNGALAKDFTGLKLKDLGDLEDIDRKLLGLEMQLAQERGQLKQGASQDERIAVMQRKGNIGMNAILSQSLAGARLYAALQGKELYQVLREKLTETMARTIAENGGLDILPEEIKKKVSAAEGQELWEALNEDLDFFELKRGIQAVNANKPGDVKLYNLLRDALPVYKDKANLASNQRVKDIAGAAKLASGETVTSSQPSMAMREEFLDFAPKRIAQLINKIPLFLHTLSVSDIEPEKINEVNGSAHDLSSPRPEDIHYIGEEDVSAYIGEAEQLVVDGRILSQKVFAGDATRLKMPGSKFLFNGFDVLHKNPEDFQDRDVQKAVREMQAQHKEKGVLNISLGARAIIEERLKIEQLAEKLGRDPREAVRNYPLLIHISDKGDDVVQEFIDADFFGFSRENVLFAAQDTFPGYGLKDGKPVPHKNQNARFAQGNAYAFMQAKQPGVAFYIDEQGKKVYLKDVSAFQYFKDKGVKFVSDCQVEDLDKLTPNVIDIERVALNIKLIREDGFNAVGDGVTNEKKEICVVTGTLDTDNRQLIGQKNSVQIVINNVSIEGDSITGVVQEQDGNWPFEGDIRTRDKSHIAIKGVITRSQKGGFFVYDKTIGRSTWFESYALKSGKQQYLKSPVLAKGEHFWTIEALLENLPANKDVPYVLAVKADPDKGEDILVIDKARLELMQLPGMIPSCVLRRGVAIKSLKTPKDIPETFQSFVQQDSDPEFVALAEQIYGRKIYEDQSKSMASNERINKEANSKVDSMDQIIAVSAESVIMNKKGFEAWVAQLPANNAVVVIASSEEYANVREFENIVYIKVVGRDISEEYGLKLIELFGAYGKSEFFGGFKLGVPASIDEYRSLAAEISSGV